LAASVLAMVADVPGNVIVVPSVPAKVSVFEPVKVLPFAMVNVPVLDVSVKPLTLVAVAAPRTGVTSVGDVLSTTAVDPVDAATPVPPCATLSGVVSPVKLVMVEFAPLSAIAFADLICAAVGREKTFVAGVNLTASVWLYAADESSKRESRMRWIIIQIARLFDSSPRCNHPA